VKASHIHEKARDRGSCTRPKSSAFFYLPSRASHRLLLYHQVLGSGIVPLRRGMRTGSRGTSRLRICKILALASVARFGRADMVSIFVVVPATVDLSLSSWWLALTLSLRVIYIAMCHLDLCSRPSLFCAHISFHIHRRVGYTYHGSALTRYWLRASGPYTQLDLLKPDS